MSRISIFVVPALSYNHTHIGKTTARTHALYTEKKSEKSGKKEENKENTNLISEARKTRAKRHTQYSKHLNSGREQKQKESCHKAKATTATRRVIFQG